MIGGAVYVGLRLIGDISLLLARHRKRGPVSRPAPSINQPLYRLKVFIFSNTRLA